MCSEQTNPSTAPMYPGQKEPETPLTGAKSKPWEVAEALVGQKRERWGSFVDHRAGALGKGGSPGGDA